MSALAGGKIKFKTKVEFHITNVCNLNCSACNKYNNYFYSGHYLWDDYKDFYKKMG